MRTDFLNLRPELYDFASVQEGLLRAFDGADVEDTESYGYGVDIPLDELFADTLAYLSGLHRVIAQYNEEPTHKHARAVHKKAAQVANQMFFIAGHAEPLGEHEEGRPHA